MLDLSHYKKALEHCSNKGSSFAEVFSEKQRTLQIEMSGGQLKTILPGQSSGVGVRTFFGDQVGYGATSNLDIEDLLKAATQACWVAGHRKTTIADNFRQLKSTSVMPVVKTYDVMSQQEKLAYLKELNDRAWDADERIVQVIVRYLERNQRIEITNSLGESVEENRVITECRVVLVMRDGNRSQMVVEGFGGYKGLEILDENPPSELIKGLVTSCSRMLKAKPSPAGTMPVIIANGRSRGGAVFHEACGHAMEADFIERGISVYRDKLNQEVARKEVSIIDDPAVPGAKGSYIFDDEGTPAQKTMIINKGRLESFLFDRFRSRRTGKSTGNGRRQSYRFPAIPRMSNIYLDQGTIEPADIIADTKKGFYVLSVGGGIVDSSTGDFSFNVQEGYLIENGALKTPVRGAVLIGNGPEMLMKIDAIGNDLAFDPGLSYCGKADQSVPSGLGCPTFRIEELVVGGTEKG